MGASRAHTGLETLKAYVCNSSNCKCEVFNDLYSPELTAASLAKFMISPVGFEHSPRCEKFESQKFMKIKFLRLYFIYVTSLPRKVDGSVISEIYFLDKNKWNMMFLGIVAPNIEY